MTLPNWQPTASIEQLHMRAKVLAAVRGFFASRDVLEVETPLLGRYSVTDPHLEVFSLEEETLFLQTSPEYAMKRLLAAGSGSIYQLSKAFRKGESSSRHNAEFTLLEWYRTGFTYQQLMDEVSELMQVFFPQLNTTAISYGDIFEKVLAVDPYQADASALEKLARSHLDIQMQSDNRDDWLNLLMAECIEPDLGKQAPIFIYDYPASQAALAKVGKNTSGIEVAKRFELYFRGLELANGYDELTDPKELQKRFCDDNVLRQKLGRPPREHDEQLLAALKAGLPNCSGVALGLDRLLMLVTSVKTIDQVLAFPFDRA